MYQVCVLVGKAFEKIPITSPVTNIVADRAEVSVAPVFYTLYTHNIIVSGQVSILHSGQMLWCLESVALIV